MHANRNDAAHHGFTTAIHSYRILVTVDRRYIDDWAKAYIGLASLLAITGDADGSSEGLRQFETNVGEIKPARAHANKRSPTCASQHPGREGAAGTSRLCDT